MRQSLSRANPQASTRASRRPSRAKHRHNEAARHACEERARQRLIRRCLDEFEAWLTQDYRCFVGFAAALGCKHPKDAVHEAWIRAQKVFDPTRGKFRRFFWTILRRTIIDFHRRRLNRPSAEPSDVAKLLELPSNEEDHSPKRIAHLRAILDRLPPEKIGPLLNHYGHEIPQRELAANLGISVAALKMRLHRGLRMTLSILREIGCRSVDDVEELGEASFHHPVVVPWPGPARSQPRPTCGTPRTKSK